MCVAKRPLYLASDVARDFACSKHIGLHPLIAASPMSTVLTVLTSSDNSNELSELAEHLTKASGSKKRRKLKTYDLVPAQLLNSMGVSGVETITLEKLATAMSKGNKMAIYFTEFCDDMGSRKGIAVSRLAEVQLAAGERLSMDIWRVHVKEVLYQAAMTEFASLKPSFTMLMGKNIHLQATGESAGSIAYGSTNRGRPPTEVEAAAKIIYNWTLQHTSKWRSLVTLLSAGGLFYCTAVHEKVNRAYIKHGMEGSVTLDKYQAWCRARLCPVDPDELDDLAGISGA